MRGVDHLRGGDASPVRNFKTVMFGQAVGVFGVDRHATGEDCRVRAHLRTALHGRVSSDRHEPVFVATHVATEEAEVHDHLHPVCSPRVLGDAHAPDQYRIFASRISSANSWMTACVRPVC